MWPEPEAAVDTEAKAEVEWLIALIRQNAASAPRTNCSAIRARRLSDELRAYLPEPSAARAALLEQPATAAVDRLARLKCRQSSRPHPGAQCSDRKSWQAMRPHYSPGRRNRYRRREGPPRKGTRRLAKGSESLAKAPRQPGLRREGQARGGRKGPRRPCAPRRRGRTAGGGAGTAGVRIAALSGALRAWRNSMGPALTIAATRAPFRRHRGQRVLEARPRPRDRMGRAFPALFKAACTDGLGSAGDDRLATPPVRMEPPM